MYKVEFWAYINTKPTTGVTSYHPTTLTLFSTITKSGDCSLSFIFSVLLGEKLLSFLVLTESFRLLSLLSIVMVCLGNVSNYLSLTLLYQGDPCFCFFSAGALHQFYCYELVV